MTFSLAITLTEYWRGMRARHKLSGENYFEAFTHLIERNRRRYGGYMIHLGVLVMGIGVIGSLELSSADAALAGAGRADAGGAVYHHLRTRPDLRSVDGTDEQRLRAVVHRTRARHRRRRRLHDGRRKPVRRRCASRRIAKSS